ARAGRGGPVVRPVPASPGHPVGAGRRPVDEGGGEGEVAGGGGPVLRRVPLRRAVRPPARVRCGPAASGVEAAAEGRAGEVGPQQAQADGAGLNHTPVGVVHSDRYKVDTKTSWRPWPYLVHVQL